MFHSCRIPPNPRSYLPYLHTCINTAACACTSNTHTHTCQCECICMNVRTWVFIQLEFTPMAKFVRTHIHRLDIHESNNWNVNAPLVKQIFNSNGMWGVNKRAGNTTGVRREFFFAMPNSHFYLSFELMTSHTNIIVSYSSGGSVTRSLPPPPCGSH